MKNDPRPPRVFHLFFRWYCRPKLRDHLEGDLLELYNHRVIKKGKREADWLFILDVMLLLRPRIIRTLKGPQRINQYSMFRSYFKIGWRNTVRNKSYAAINICGLAVGIAACLLIFLIVQFETSFDNFHNNRDRIYRVVAATKTPDGINYSKSSAFPVAQGLKIDYGQLEHAARIWIQDGQQVTVMNNNKETSQKKFKEDFLFFADPEFFDIFNYPFIAGNPETALSEPNTVVLTQETAEKYFGDWHNAVGRYVKYDNRRVCKVTGILKNTPANTDIPLQVVFSFKTSPLDTSADWVSQTGNLSTFVMLPKNLHAQQFNNDLATFVKKHTPAEYANQGYILQPLKDIHYNTKFGTFRGTTFSRELITTISLIGVFLLIIACVNFVNLATAQAVNRSKEVGVRKVLGSSKKQLIFQFLSETFIITLVAVLFAIIIAYVALPSLNTLLQTSMKMRFDFSILAFLLAGIIAVTLLSGFYPALVLSGFQPVSVLKSRFRDKISGGLSLRRVLVVFQFTIAQALIIATLVAVKQMNFFRNTSMGFDKDAIVTVGVPNDSTSQSKIAALKLKLLQQPGIKNVSYSIFSPADNSHWGSDFRFDNAIKATDFDADLKWADADYFETYDIKFIAGNPYHNADTVTGFVVNKMLAKKMGFKNPADILGKKIDFWEGVIAAPVIGVVEDFHGTTLAKQMKPMVFGSLKNAYQQVNIKLQPHRVKQTLSAIENLWKNHFPDNIYEYQFLDDKIASFYRQEDQLSQLYKAFAAIAIFISCLGLYGLVSFMAVQRTKEVGIRKVLGASVSNILYLFSKEFTLLIALAFTIAAPAAWLFMRAWLQNFAYRTSIGAGVFMLTILMAVLIAWITVAYQSIKAATAKPVNSLRME